MRWRISIPRASPTASSAWATSSRSSRRRRRRSTPKRRMRIAEKMRKGKFDLEDLREQLAQVEKIGGMGGIMGMLPGMAKMKEQMAAAKIDEQDDQAPARHHLVDDARPSGATPTCSRRRARSASRRARAPRSRRSTASSRQHRQMADMMKIDGRRRASAARMGKMAYMFGMGGGDRLAGMPQRRRRSSWRSCRSRCGGLDAGGMPGLPLRAARACRPRLPASAGPRPGCRASAAVQAAGAGRHGRVQPVRGEEEVIHRVHRHCERAQRRSNPVAWHDARLLGCFASLAMTALVQPQTTNSPNMKET